MRVRVKRRGERKRSHNLKHPNLKNRWWFYFIDRIESYWYGFGGGGWPLVLVLEATASPNWNASLTISKLKWTLPC